MADMYTLSKCTFEEVKEILIFCYKNDIPNCIIKFENGSYFKREYDNYKSLDFVCLLQANYGTIKYSWSSYVILLEMMLVYENYFPKENIVFKCNEWSNCTNVKPARKQE